jgi:hypothetical protein
MTIMSRLVAANLRHNVKVGVLAASVATAFAIGASTEAHATLNWDGKGYDSCIQTASASWSAGATKVTSEEATKCCTQSGGTVSQQSCSTPAQQDSPDGPLSQPPAKPAQPIVVAPMAPVK